MKKTFFIFTLFLVFLSLGVGAKDKSFDKDGYIFSKKECEKEYGYNVLSQTLKRKECWMPTEAEVRELESRLEPALKARIAELEKNKDSYALFHGEEKDRYKHLKKELYNDYFREYWGIITDKNEKIIYVNGFCASGMIPHQRSDLGKRIDVEGGGSCYFKAAYDLKEKTFFNIRINAPM